MRVLVCSLVLATGSFTPFIGTYAQAPAPAVAPATKYSSGNTEIGTLMDNKELWAIVIRHLPELASNEQIVMARGLTLKAIQSYAADVITDAKLAALDADLAKVQ